jgi:hypothetical protein
MEKPRNEAVDERAAELRQETKDDDLKDPETARDAAGQILKESRERQEQAEDLDPADDDVIRRSSEETAAEPE